MDEIFFLVEYDDDLDGSRYALHKLFPADEEVELCEWLDARINKDEYFQLKSIKKISVLGEYSLRSSLVKTR